MSSNLPYDFEGDEEAERIQNEWNLANNRKESSVETN